MIVRSGWSARWRAALAAALVLVAATALASPQRADAAPPNAALVVGFKEPDPSHSRVVIHGVGFKRVGLYGVTVNGNPTQAASIAVQSGSPARHRFPAANQLVQFPNITTSALLDYALWRYSSTTDDVQGAGLALVAFHLTGQKFGTPSIGSIGPGDAAWGPPGNASPGLVFLIDPQTPEGGPAPAPAVPLGDLVEQSAKDIVSSAAGFLGPWTLDLTLAWGSQLGTVMVRSASNTPIPNLTVSLSSSDATVPASVVTDNNGQATFTFTPSGSEATVNATAGAPGVHTEWDVAGEALNTGYQRVAVGTTATLNDSFTVKQPQITTFAKDAVDGDKVIGAGGSIIDAVQYLNLTPGATYTARVTWQYQDNAQATALSATRTFVAAGGGTGSVDVGPVVTGPAEVGRSLVAYEFLYAGPTVTGFPDVIHANINDPDQTVSVESVLLNTTAHDTSDGDKSALAGGAVVDVVAYQGLQPGVKYTAQAEWHFTDGFNDLGPTGMTATRTFFADPLGVGTVDVGPSPLTGNTTGTQIVAYERIYAGDTATGTPLGTHESPSDQSQMVEVVTPTLLSQASDVADGDKNVAALGLVRDRVVYSNLQPNQLYTVVLALHYSDGGNDLGFTGLTMSNTFTVTDSGGEVIVGPLRLSGAVSGAQLVAFDRIYRGTDTTVDPVATHEVPFDPNQMLFVGEQTISTDATEGTATGEPIPGDKDIAIGSDATIVDTVTVQLTNGTNVVVTGLLVRIEDGVCSDPVVAVTQSAVVRFDHTFEVVYPVPEAPGDYVSYVIVKNQQGTVVLVEHQDCLAPSQRVTVTTGDLPATH